MQVYGHVALCKLRQGWPFKSDAVNNMYSWIKITRDITAVEAVEFVVAQF